MMKATVIAFSASPDFEAQVREHAARSGHPSFSSYVRAMLTAAMAYEQARNGSHG